MERRKHQRYPVRQENYYRATIPHPYRVVNVSRSGCFIESHRILGRMETDITFHLPLPADADSLPLSAKIVRQVGEINRNNQDYILYALQFENMDDLSETILGVYLDFLKKEVHVAQLEETWLKIKRVVEKYEILAACEERKKVKYLH